MKVNISLAKRKLAEFLSKSIDIPHIHQPGENLCWATCIKMVEEWAGIQIHLCNYVKLETPHCMNCNELKKNGACDKRRKPNNLLHDWKRFGYINTKHSNSHLNFSQVKVAIAARHPVQAYFLHDGGDGAHVVLISGAIKTEDLDDALVVVDPAKKIRIVVKALDLMEWGRWTQSWEVSR